MQWEIDIGPIVSQKKMRPKSIFLETLNFIRSSVVVGGGRSLTSAESGVYDDRLDALCLSISERKSA